MTDAEPGGLDALFADDVSTEPDPEVRRRRGLTWPLDAALLAAGTATLATLAGLLPQRVDSQAAGQAAARVDRIVETWPHVSWAPDWHGGAPLVDLGEGPLPSLAAAALAGGTGMSGGSATGVLAVAALLTLILAAYAAARAASESRLGGWVAALLAAAAPAVWGTAAAVEDRVLWALALGTVALACAVRVGRSGRRWSVVGAAAAGAGAVASDLTIGALFLVIAVVVIAAGTRESPATRVALGGVVVAGAVGLAAPVLVVATAPDAGSDRPLGWARVLGTDPENLAALAPAVLVLAVAVAAVLARRLWRSPDAAVDPASWSTARRRLAAIEGDGAAVRLTDRIRGWRAYGGEAAYAPTVACVAIGVAVALLGLAWYDGGGAVTAFDLRLGPRPVLAVVGVLLAVGTGLLAGATARERRGDTRDVMAVLPAVVALGLLLVVAGVLPTESDDVRAAAPAGTPLIGDVPGLGRVAAAARHGGAPGLSPLPAAADPERVVASRNLRELGEVLRFPRAAEPMRSFFLDWYGIQRFRTGGALDRGLPYRQAERSESVYDAPNPSSSAAAVSGPTVLVVGDDDHYLVAWRALAPSGVDSRELVVVHGPERIDALRPEDLRGVGTVLVYGAQVGDPAAAAAVLRGHVEAGGTLVVDAADRAAELTRLAEVPGGPLPVGAFRAAPLGGEWGFELGASGGRCAERAAYERLAPPLFGERAAWGVVVLDDVASWGRTVVEAQNARMVVTGALGRGQVVVSGLNLPYHAFAYGNAAESGMLARCLGAAAAAPADSPEPEPPATQPLEGERFGPASYRFAVPAGAHGLLLRQHADPDWRATVDGRGVRVRSAGPDLVYVAVPPRDGEQVVTLVHGYPTRVRVAAGASAVTAAALPVWALGLLPLAAAGRTARNAASARRQSERPGDDGVSE